MLRPKLLASHSHFILHPSPNASSNPVDFLYPMNPDQTTVYPLRLLLVQSPILCYYTTFLTFCGPQHSSQNSSHHASLQMRTDDVNHVIFLVSVVQWLPIRPKYNLKSFLCSAPHTFLRLLSLLPYHSLLLIVFQLCQPIAVLQNDKHFPVSRHFILVFSPSPSFFS